MTTLIILLISPFSRGEKLLHKMETNIEDDERRDRKRALMQTCNYLIPQDFLSHL